MNFKPKFAKSQNAFGAKSEIIIKTLCLCASVVKECISSVFLWLDAHATCRDRLLGEGGVRDKGDFSCRI